jgi:hypothetical protein
MQLTIAPYSPILIWIANNIKVQRYPKRMIEFDLGDHFANTTINVQASINVLTLKCK